MVIIIIIIIITVFFGSCPSAIWQVSLFMTEIGSLSFRFLWWRCIFYSLLFLLLLVWFDIKKKCLWPQWLFVSLSFYILGAAPFFFLLPAASVCVTTLCLFQTCIIIIKKMKMNHSSDVCFLCFLGWRRRKRKTLNSIYKIHFFRQVYRRTACDRSLYLTLLNSSLSASGASN